MPPNQLSESEAREAAWRKRWPGYPTRSSQFDAGWDAHASYTYEQGVSEEAVERAAAALIKCAADDPDVPPMRLSAEELIPQWRPYARAALNAALGEAANHGGEVSNA